MARQIDILFDPDRQSVVQSFDYLAGNADFQESRLPRFMLGDDYRLNLYAPAGFSGWTTATGKVGIGLPPGVATAPTQGTWYAEYDSDITAGPLVSAKRYKTVTYETGDDFENIGGINANGGVWVSTGTTPTDWTNGSIIHEVAADIEWDASAADVKTAFDALSILTGTFDVTGEGPWTLIYSLTTDLEAFLIGSENLEPQSNGSSSVLQSGNGLNTREKIIVRLSQAVSASTTVFTNIAVTNASNVVQPVQQGGSNLNEIKTVELLNFPYAGSFTLAVGNSISAPIAYSAGADEMQTALEGVTAFGANNVNVRKTGSYKWEVEAIGGKTNTNIADMTAAITGLTFAVGRYVELPLNTDNMIAAVGTRASKAMTFEIELTISGDVETPVQEPVTVVNDVFDPAATTASPTDTPVTDADIGYLIPAWRYDITDLTGGSANDLDAVVTTTKVAGYRIDIYIGSALASYVLLAATTAEASPGIIRPDDYAGGTNAKVWVQIA